MGEITRAEAGASPLASPAYLAPEQAMGGAVTPKTDLYSLGAMLYEMTTGQRPYQQENEVAIIRAILDIPVEPPPSLVPGYPPELAAIVMKALAKNGFRYPFAQYGVQQDVRAGMAVSYPGRA